MKKILIALLTVFALTATQALDFEVGYELDEDLTHAPFLYVTEDFYLTEFKELDTQLWFSPSVEIEFNTQEPWEFWVQAQFLADGPLATLSARAKYTSDEIFEFRLGLLFSID